ncbi:thiol-disulfide oxidoreductase DCC family protein [Methylobacterium oryzisoli]|uniref:thiol-disulfide oxidoreductase DCC family protein n=1 Tax=Methylobacterium oryzisoli TaxID=3385502 RepID=UPI0038918B0F
MREDWRPRPLPEAPDGLILYDGVCVLCSAFVRFVVARDRGARWRFVPVQSPYGRALAARLGIDPEHPQTVAALRDGTAYFKLDAAAAVLRDWPAWAWTRFLTRLPRPLAEWLYDRIARNRYRLFGRTACTVPPPQLAGRVLTEAP